MKKITMSNFASRLLYKEHNITPLDQHLLECVRPLTYFNDGVEGMQDCFRYSMGGSGFIINYAGDLLFLTARHNITKGSFHENNNAPIKTTESMFLIKNILSMGDLKNAEERLHFRSLYSPPLVHEFDNLLSTGSGLYSAESQDITIGVLDDTYNGGVVHWNHQPGLKQTNDDLSQVQLNDILYVVGFPKATNYVEYNTDDNYASMFIKKCHLLGFCSHIFDSTQAEMTITKHCDQNINIDGVSGSPVFKYDRPTNSYKLAGMVISGDPKDGTKIRFLTVNYLSIHIMMTDIKFPFNFKEDPTMQIITNKLIHSLEKKIGSENISVVENSIAVKISQNSTFSFDTSHEIYYYVINLLESTSAFSEKNIYILANIFSYTKNWTKLFHYMLKNKMLIDEEYIKKMDAVYHDAEEYCEGILDSETIIKKLI